MRVLEVDKEREFRIEQQYGEVVIIIDGKRYPLEPGQQGYLSEMLHSAWGWRR